MEEGDKSKFNMGIAMLYRINGLISDMVSAKLTDNPRLWFNILLVLDSEINFTFKDDVLDKDILFQNEIADMLNNGGDKGELYTLLILYEKFIRKELSDRDMLIARKEDVRKAIPNY